jgi:hypothetical protein
VHDVTDMDNPTGSMNSVRETSWYICGGADRLDGCGGLNGDALREVLQQAFPDGHDEAIRPDCTGPVGESADDAFVGTEFL